MGEDLERNVAPARRWRLEMLVLACAGAGIAGLFVMVARAPNDATPVLDAWAAAREGVETLKLTVAAYYDVPEGSVDVSALTPDQTLTYASSNGKVFCSTVSAGGRTEIEAYDGFATRAYFPGSNEGRIESALPGLPTSHLVPVPWAIENLGAPLPVLVDGAEKVDDLSTNAVLVLLANGLGNTEYRIHLDPARGFALLKVEGFRTDGKKEPLQVLDFSEYTAVEGVWFPGRVDGYGFSGGKPSTHNVYRVESLHVNETIPDSTFDVRFPEGTRVDDLR